METTVPSTPSEQTNEPARRRAPQRRTLPTDVDRYRASGASVLVDAVHSSVRDLVRLRFAESSSEWSSFVVGDANRLVTTADIEAIERRILDIGHRFQWSSMVSLRDRPEIYAAADGDGRAAADFSFEHPDAVVAPCDPQGREQRGVGDNVVSRSVNVRGIARHIRTLDRVIDWMTNGVPDNTIAVIDDSGGTLTAPILERFAGVICAGGTVRSHLGILTREYGIACLMNARISGIRDGDTVELESTAAARTAESYQQGVEMNARIWRLA